MIDALPMQGQIHSEPKSESKVQNAQIWGCEAIAPEKN